MRRAPLFLVLFAMCGGPPVRADTAEDARGGPPPRPFFIELSYTPSVLFRADLKEAEGRVTTRHHDVTGTVMIPLPPRGRVNLAVSRDRSEYRFRDNEDVAGLLEDAYETRLTAAYMGRLNDRWSLFSMGSVRWSAEKGASESDSRMHSGMVLFQHQWREHLQLGVGGLAASRLDERPLVIPTASVSWDITDRLTLRTLRGLHLLYTLDQAGAWRAGLNGEYHSRYIRRNDEGIAPEGVFRNRLFLTSLSLFYRPNPGVFMGVELGYIPWREISIKDADGDTAFQSKTDPAFSAAFTARMTF